VERCPEKNKWQHRERHEISATLGLGLVQNGGPRSCPNIIFTKFLYTQVYGPPLASPKMAKNNM